jgi:hypothetical protein
MSYRLNLFARTAFAAAALLGLGASEGNAAVPVFAIAGTVYCDSNSNGVIDTDDHPEPGVTVQLYRNGVFVEDTQTGPDGTYLFEDDIDPEETFTVVVLPPASTPAIASFPGLYAISISPSVIRIYTDLAGYTVATPGFRHNDFLLACADTAISGNVYCDSNFNGVLDGSDQALSGILVQLLVDGVAVDQMHTDFSGSYRFETGVHPLMTFRVRVVPPASHPGIASYPGSFATSISPSIIEIFTAAAGLPEFQNNDFLLACPPAGPFTTFTPGGWGSKPAGSNPGMLLSRNFAGVFPSGVTIGGTLKLRFTSAAAIQKFLPAGGKPGSLAGQSPATLVDPTKSNAGVFAGHVLALKLSVSFSDAMVLRQGLGDLKVRTGPLAGKTVRQVLAEAERLLGGGAPAGGFGLNHSQMNDILAKINENFVDGKTDKGYLIP